MKKLFCTIFLAMAGTALFGVDFSLSAGAGGILGGAFTRYSLSASGSKGSLDQKQKADQFNYGFFGFFDATYGIFSISFQNGSSSNNDGGMIYKSWESMLGFSLLGKYPFKLNERFTIFPLLGAEYQLCLVKLRTNPGDSTVFRWNDDDTFYVRDWNTFFINLGGGLDFKLPKNFFLRSELLYSIRLMTPYEKKFLDQIKSDTGDSKPKLGGLSSGPSIRLSAGYRFYTKTKKPKPAETEPAAAPPPEPIQEIAQKPETAPDTSQTPETTPEITQTPEETAPARDAQEIEDKIRRTRQEIIDRGFVEYDPENFENADEIAESALDTYEDGDEETAFALADDALLRYNIVLQNGWAYYAAAKRTGAAEERENALANKANVAVRYLFRDAEDLYKKAEDNFAKGSYEDAGILYVEAEALYTIAGRETGEKRQRAQEMLKKAEEKIEESEKIME